ncbi:ATP-dependent Clp protease proteolytic subunit [Pseudomonas sp. SWRI59]|uniref:ATP-dependent Clp protease proteolytic subunit n=1 Tax=unclassified Pseudomonas TaxID=196821 RepID=UPI0016457A61|nr:MULTISPECIES: ATP-dependent Clp protease proteolytic subunit [unclassified Pseudomonas]MBC3504360.1 ATP-dependent Clp protease proteolytic subunit [Pseudomonas sp. SWRI59]MBC3509665.1 ATP-dependent Clp protease proteolytic subunit [Pseudomonas sp. SWRI68]
MNTTQRQDLVTIYPSKNILIKQLKYTQYVVPTTGPIGEIDEYGELTEILANATAKDEIHIQLFSPGGSLETCDYLCRRIAECTANIVVEIGMTCASAASAIALQADEWVIHDSSTMMIHACSYSPGYGKESDVRAGVAYTERVNREWVQRTYAGFLTDDEFVAILDNGKDLYFFADDLRERLPIYAEYRAEWEAE